MENKCPKCGAKLSVFYLKPECPKCGCNIMNYNMEDSLIVKNGHTPTYMAVLDHFGEMVSAVVDMKT